MKGAWSVGWLVVAASATIGLACPVEAACPSGSTPDIEAALERGVYQQAESLSRVQVDSLRKQHGENSIEAADASDCLVRALLLNGRGAEAATVALAEGTLLAKQAALGTTHSGLIASLINLGDVLIETAQYNRAVETLERAAKVCEAAGGIQSIDLAHALDRLGAALIADGRLDAAVDVLQRSMRVKESIPMNVGVARTLEGIAAALQAKGSYDQSGEAIRKAAAIQASIDESHPAYAETLNLLGLQRWFEGDLADARAVAARAVTLAERTLRPGHPRIARYLKYLGGASGDLGDLAESRALRARALAIAEASLGSDHPETAGYLIDLANVEFQLGAYPTARTLYERALEIAAKRLGAWHDRVATAVYNLAWVEHRLGDYASARRLFARAIDVWEHVRGRDHPFVAVGLTGLATIERERGTAIQALPLLERALAIREQSLGTNHRQVARTLLDLATTLNQVGRVTRAQDLARRALRILEGLDAPLAVDLSTAYALQAELQANSGDLVTARKHYERALTIRQQVFGLSHPRVAEIQIPLARALARLGEREAAFKTAMEAERLGRDHLDVMVRYLPERESLNYAAKRPQALGVMLSLSDAMPASRASTFDSVIRARGVVFDEMALRRKAAVDARRPELGPSWSALASARQRLANLIVRGPSDQRPKEYLRLIDGARAEKESIERELAASSAEFRAELQRQNVGLHEVQSVVPTGTALVSFLRYDRTAPGARTVAHYAAFVLLPGRAEPRVVQLGIASTIDRAVTRWRRTAASGLWDVESASAADATYRIAGNQLRQRVWDPLLPDIQGAERVLVVPDGALNLVNFGALPVGTVEYLVERRPTIHYLATERDLVMGAESGTTGAGLLAIGGPDFDDTPIVTRRSKTTLRGAPCGTLQSIVFSNLPGTLREATDIAALWKSASALEGDAPVQLAVAKQATERAFKERAPGRRILHLATHGFFLGADCTESLPGTRAVGRVGPARPRPKPAATFENPLLASGLAFAGANRRARAKPDQDDGILTAEEIAGMNLQGTEWAVLSACDTGLGEVRAGEGVFGLRRAFQIAGVRTVIMSLWSVEDEATREWMQALYKARLKQRLDTAHSMRAASLQVLRDRRAKKVSTHPFYWAAFVAAGDWR